MAISTDSSSIALANGDPASDAPSTPALLALQRFVRRTLRQVSLSLGALILIVGMAAQVPAEMSVEISGISASSSYASEVSVAEALSPSQLTPTLTPHRLLSAKMTHHRLTGARLSLPPTQNRVIAQLADTTVSHRANETVEH